MPCHKLLLTPSFLLMKTLLQSVMLIVDDLIYWERNRKDIVELAIQLCAQGVDLEQVDDAARFLGVHIECNPNTGFLNMTQKV